MAMCWVSSRGIWFHGKLTCLLAWRRISSSYFIFKIVFKEGICGGWTTSLARRCCLSCHERFFLHVLTAVDCRIGEMAGMSVTSLGKPVESSWWCKTNIIQYENISKLAGKTWLNFKLFFTIDITVPSRVWYNTLKYFNLSGMTTRMLEFKL